MCLFVCSAGAELRDPVQGPGAQVPLEAPLLPRPQHALQLRRPPQLVSAPLPAATVTSRAAQPGRPTTGIDSVITTIICYCTYRLDRCDVIARSLARAV